MDPPHGIRRLPLDKEKLKTLDTLICNYCNHYLNILPIMSFQNGTTMCGRCYKPSNFEGVPQNCKPMPNLPLEGLIQFMPFACIYRENGCPARHATKDYLNHEARCRFRSFLCPVAACTWKGLLKEVKPHFETDHPDNISQTPVITINTSVGNTEYFLINCENQEILFQCKYVACTNKYYCDCVSLTNLHQQGEFTLELEFKSVDNTGIFFKKPILNILERIDENKALKIDVLSLKTLLDTDYLQATVKIFSDVKEDWKSYDPRLLNELKCPICLQLFAAPVFLCSNGHSICNGCKRQMTSCPICRAVYENAVHNFALEKLVGILVYPCKHHVSGCTFSALSTQIAQHEIGCEYACVENVI